VKGVGVGEGVKVGEGVGEGAKKVVRGGTEGERGMSW
jgi:hypothetical protein